MSQLQLDNEDYRWLVEALGGPGTSPSQPALAWPSAAAPELLVPLGSAAASAAALRRFHNGRTRIDLVRTVAAITVARLGALRFAPGQSVDIGPFAAVDRLAEELREDDLLLGITLGPRRRNRKPVLQLIRRDGTTIGFAKIGWSPLTRALVENEASWLRRLAGVLPSGIQIPSILAHLEVDGTTVVLVSALDTSARSGMGQHLSPDAITSLARSLGTERATFAELPYLESLRRGRVGEVVDVDQLMERHAEATLELGIWHGDLTPWNTATCREVSQVWDWEFANEHRPVGFDLLHTTFESIRRSARHNEEAALRAVADNADQILTPIGQPVEATLDLYLCELIMREARLKDEGWDPSDLGPLECHTTELLRRRLA